MVQTRGQQTRDQSPSGHGALWGVTAEGDVVTTTVSSGNTLKDAFSVPSAEHSTNIHAGVGAGWEGLVSPVGTGSLTQVSVSIPRGMSAHPLGIVSQVGDGARMTDRSPATESCSGIEGAVASVASTAHNAPYSTPPHRHPVGQPIVFRDLGSGTETANLGSQSGVSNLFGLSAPVYAETVPTGAPNTTPTAAVHARSAPAARVDKIGSETTLRDQLLGNYDARLRQEGSVSLVLNAMAGASVLCSIGHSHVAHPGADSTSNPLHVGESVSPWTRHQESIHRLSAYAKQLPLGSQYVSEGILRINAWPVPRYDETSDDDNYQPGFRTQTQYGTRGPSLAHPDVTRGCQEWLSRHDWYEASARPAPTPLSRQKQAKGLLHSTTNLLDRGPARPYPQGPLAQMQDFQGDGGVTLGMFSDQVDELSRFYHWDKQEACCQARAHLMETALAYVRS